MSFWSFWPLLEHQGVIDSFWWKWLRKTDMNRLQATRRRSSWSCWTLWPRRARCIDPTFHLQASFRASGTPKVKPCKVTRGSTFFSLAEFLVGSSILELQPILQAKSHRSACRKRAVVPLRFQWRAQPGCPSGALRQLAYSKLETKTGDGPAVKRTWYKRATSEIWLVSFL